MKTLVFSPAAEADIDDIWDYSADNWEPDQADRYTDAIRDTCHAIAAGDKRGRVVDIRAGYLKASTGSHIVYFRDSGEQVEVIRVLHVRQDVDRHL